MKQGLGKEYLRLFVRAALFLLILYLVFTRVLFLGRVTGMEMYPSLKDGDLALGYRLRQEFRTGDVVVYDKDGELRFGRVAGKESDGAEEILLVQGDYRDGEESTVGGSVSGKQVKAKVITIIRRRGL